jgi:hypothetical protein
VHERCYPIKQCHDGQSSCASDTPETDRSPTRDARPRAPIRIDQNVIERGQVYAELTRDSVPCRWFRSEVRGMSHDRNGHIRVNCSVAVRQNPGSRLTLPTNRKATIFTYRRSSAYSRPSVRPLNSRAFDNPWLIRTARAIRGKWSGTLPHGRHSPRNAHEPANFTRNPFNLGIIPWDFSRSKGKGKQCVAQLADRESMAAAFVNRPMFVASTAVMEVAHRVRRSSSRVANCGSCVLRVASRVGCRESVPSGWFTAAGFDSHHRSLVCHTGEHKLTGPVGPLGKDGGQMSPLETFRGRLVVVYYWPSKNRMATRNRGPFPAKQ